MPTYFAGSTLDALIGTPNDVVDDATSFNVTNTGSVNAPLRDPSTGLRMAASRLWSHINLTSALAKFNYNTSFLTWYNANDVPLFRVYGTGDRSNSDLILQYWSGAEWVSVGLPLYGGPGAYDVLIDQGAGRLAWYRGGVTIADVRGLTLPDLGGVAYMQVRSTSSFGNTCSEVILASYNTIGHTVRRRAPASDDTNTGWAGTYADVDDVVNSDTDAINSSIVGAEITFGAAALSATAAGNVIKSVSVAARIRNDGGEVPRNAAAVLRSGGVSRVAPFNLDVGSGYAGAVTCFDTNPATGLKWASIDDVNGSFGLKATD